MFSRNRDDTTRAEQPGGISPAVHSVLAVRLPNNVGRTFSKEPRPSRSAGDGVSTYLALIFGTLLSSQGTDASFVLTRETLSGFPPGASLRSCVSDSIRPFSDPISSVLSRFPLSRFPFRRFRLYQTLSCPIPCRGFCLGSGTFRPVPFDIHYASRFPLQLIIEFRKLEFRHAGTPNWPPLRGVVGSGLAAPGCWLNAVPGSSGSDYITEPPGTRQVRRRRGVWAR